MIFIALFKSAKYFTNIGLQYIVTFVYLHNETEDYNIWQIFWRVYGWVDCQGKGEGGLWTGAAEDSGQVAGQIRQTFTRRTV